ncbi:MAG: alkaline phosphatase [Candidatus Ventricola sp.]
MKWMGALLCLMLLAALGVSAQAETGAPKYVFLFIGDGMSYPQIQLAADYLGAIGEEGRAALPPGVRQRQWGDGDTVSPVRLSFMDFAVTGSAMTYDAGSFVPDSASTATAMATGTKTWSGWLGQDTDGGRLETIAEKLHAQLGWRIGIVTTMNLNHGTPAAFYAHQDSRNNYYEIGVELTQSGFEYFAGGEMRRVYGADKDQRSLYELAQEAGYKVTFSPEEAAAVTAQDGKVILSDVNLTDSGTMDFVLDRGRGEWSLADYVEKGIEVLEDGTGFFMMCEGGLIDWACHSNDAGTAIAETLAFADAVQVAVDFARAHPDETLILVTGDHETGGLTIGFAGTDYRTHLEVLARQRVSFQRFEERYAAVYRKEGAAFEEAMRDVEELFGLKTEGDKGDRLVLTAYELEQLREAYDLMLGGCDVEQFTQEQALRYGENNPFCVTVTRILANKAGLDFTTFAHTGLPVAVFAEGVGAERFGGYCDNTDIFRRLAALLGVE